MGESQSNGVIERAVGLVADQARTLKAALEHRMGTRVPPDARILCWLVEFAAYLIWTGAMSAATGGRRFRGCMAEGITPLILDFGEKILYSLAKPARGRKLGTAIPSWSVRGDAELVVRSSGCHLARNGDQDTLSEHQKIPESERWDADKIHGIRAVPWSPDGSDNAYDIQVGMERPADMMPRAPGHVLMENSGDNLPSQCRLRTMGSQ